MRKTLTAAVALVTMAAAFVAVAAGGTRSAAQHGPRVRIEVKGTDPFTFTMMSQGGIQTDLGSATFCCWRSWDVIRAGTKVEVTNPKLTFHGDHGTLTIRERIEWVPLPDGWSVFTGTWKVVGGTRGYAGFSGHGRLAGAAAPETAPERDLRIRIFGFLGR